MQIGDGQAEGQCGFETEWSKYDMEAVWSEATLFFFFSVSENKC